MKTQNFKTITLLLVVFLTSTSMNLMAQDEQERPRRQGPDAKALADKRLKIPDLTDAQSEQIKKIRVKAQQQTLPIKNTMREKRARLTTLSTTEKANMNEINKVVEEIGDLQTQLMKHRETSRQEIRALLNDEQRVFFDSHMQRRHRGKHQKHRRG
ncbi:periplasmic heavy metal sensor [Fulvivirgaceae bacterium BMA12]|uniref:Periplasmic heavy metal sensor n=1 Tax=Agaribacillus aureus TaxID=3051825 RepID=A0ABT8L0W6_9BACT|nr:periplasmic heavy metal sensor [Fulvivirgaceae bacterium BMA12]